MVSDKIYCADLTRLPYGTKINLYPEVGLKWVGKVVENIEGIKKRKSILNLDTQEIVVITDETNFKYDIEILKN